MRCQSRSLEKLGCQNHVWCRRRSQDGVLVILLGASPSREPVQNPKSTG